MSNPMLCKSFVSWLIKLETPVARRPPADSGVRNYRTGLLRVTRMQGFDLVGFMAEVGCLRLS